MAHRPVGFPVMAVAEIMSPLRSFGEIDHGLAKERLLKYVSTRGRSPAATFEDVLLAGLARDGGLYVPDSWPLFGPDEIKDLRGLSYQGVAHKIISRFVGDSISAADLSELIDKAYSSFGHKAITPLRQTGANEWVLELFHGPTYAFKDVALQLLGQFFGHFSQKRQAPLTIVGATSGDTGSAAIEGLRGVPATDLFILHPKGRVSEMQRLQMTTVADQNVHNIAIEGTFDDCQALVKELFNDLPFRDEVNLAGVNSINWARVMAQIVYYIYSAVALGAPDRKMSFSVPTGNFGDIYAGYAAKRMGLPIERLIIATNVNDILARCVATDRYEVEKVVPTMSPSMDIQVSSNFERLLFDAGERDGEEVNRYMSSLKQSGSFTVREVVGQSIRQDFDAIRVDEDQTRKFMRKSLNETNTLVDPHTAVGLAAAAAQRPDSSVPMVTLATAHPAKFADAVTSAVDQPCPLPVAFEKMRDLPERLNDLPNDVVALRKFILEQRVSAS